MKPLAGLDGRMGLVDGESVGELAPGQSVLVAGPPMTGKYELVIEHLAAHDGAVVVSTNQPAAGVIEDYRAVDGEEERVGVVDCISRGDRNGGVPESERVTYVNTHRNLTRIGVAFTEMLDSFGDGVGIGLHNAAALLVYADMETVYKFLQVFTGQAGTREATCVVALDTGGEERQEVLAQLFDGVVETRESDGGGRERRVRGLGEDTEWQKF